VLLLYSVNQFQIRVETAVFKIGNKAPTTSTNFYLAPGAMIIGDVQIGQDVSIWFNAVIRGDNDSISIGDGTNIQDLAMLHVDPGHPLVLGKRVTVGHKAMLHGCSVGDGSLIGMNAVVLNDAVIGRGCLIGANALVKEGMQIPDGSLVLGSPGKVVKQIDEKAQTMMAAGAQHYIDKIVPYRDGLQTITS